MPLILALLGKEFAILCIPEVLLPSVPFSPEQRGESRGLEQDCRELGVILLTRIISWLPAPSPQRGLM